MNSFHFSLGNSTSGPIGFCAQVAANTRGEAAAKLRRAVQQSTGAAGEVLIRSAGPNIEYLAVYFNPDAIRASDIDEAMPGTAIE
jgi:hypothetical protein